MSDITKCSGTKCAKKDTCFRYLAKADGYQSWFAKMPNNEDGTCDHYWEVKSKSELKRLQIQNDF
jgi:hypothetical protein